MVLWSPAQFLQRARTCNAWSRVIRRRGRRSLMRPVASSACGVRSGRASAVIGRGRRVDLRSDESWGATLSNSLHLASRQPCGHRLQTTCLHRRPFGLTCLV